MELNEKFRFLRRAQTVVDLGFAPGAWSQVALANVGPRGRVLGVDLLPVRPPRGCSAIQANFLSKNTHLAIVQYLIDRDRGRRIPLAADPHAEDALAKEERGLYAASVTRTPATDATDAAAAAANTAATAAGEKAERATSAGSGTESAAEAGKKADADEDAPARASGEAVVEQLIGESAAAIDKPKKRGRPRKGKLITVDSHGVPEDAIGNGNGNGNGNGTVNGNGNGTVNGNGGDAEAGPVLQHEESYIDLEKRMAGLKTIVFDVDGPRRDTSANDTASETSTAGSSNAASSEPDTGRSASAQGEAVDNNGVDADDGSTEASRIAEIERTRPKLVDVVLSDMCAPFPYLDGLVDARLSYSRDSALTRTFRRMSNTTGMRAADHAASIDLCDAALLFCVNHLKPRGSFVCKVFDGRESDELRDRMKQVFRRVQTVKPDSSRRESTEIYLVGMNRIPGVEAGDVKW